MNCTQQSAHVSPVEQLPNPETGKEKPQLYFLFERSLSFWNLPIPAEIDSKLRTHTHLFVSDDPTELQNKLREFNARSHNFLVMASDKIQNTAEELSIYKHPSRAFSLNVHPDALQSFSWALDSAQKLVSTFCSKNSHLLTCVLDPELPKSFREGFSLASPSSPQKHLLRISFKKDLTEDTLLLAWDWIVWLEQIFRNFNNSSQAHGNAPWKTLSLENGNFKIDLKVHPSSPLFPQQEDLRNTLMELRMKALQGLPL